jgi:hypothetical protein
MADVRHLLGDLPGHSVLRNPRPTKERWDADEKSVDELVVLVQDALQFNARTNGRDRITELRLSNEQVAEQLKEIYYNIVYKS